MKKKLAIEGGKPIKEEKPLYKYGGADIYGREEVNAVKEVLEAGSPFRYYGPELLNKSEEFEKKFAKFTGTKYALAVTSGTAAVHVALGAIGIGPGDEVITTPMCWVSDAMAILYQNAIPIFADINFRTLCVDPQEIRKKITDKTKAILLVHYSGLPAEMDEIMQIAKENDLYVIEDASHAYGAEHKGHKIGSIGHISCFSCQFIKAITCGDGGVVATSEDKVYERAYRFHDLGLFHHKRTDSPMLGYNYRITEMQSAILVEQLKKINYVNEKRRENAEYFLEGLKDIGGVSSRVVPNYVIPVYYNIPVLVDWTKVSVSYNEFQKAMEAEGTPVGRISRPPYYSNFLKSQNVYLRSKCPFQCPWFGKKVSYENGLCPKAEKAYDEYIAISNSPCLTKKDMNDYIRALEKVMKAYKKN